MGHVSLLFGSFSSVKLDYSIRVHLVELLDIMGNKQRCENRGTRTEYGKGHGLKFRHKRNSDKMHPSAELSLLEKTEVKFYSESGPATSQVSRVCIANCSYHPQDRKLLLLLNSLNKLKARWQQCHEMVYAIILICSAAFMSLVHISQSKPNTDNYAVKLFSIRNGC